MFDNIENLKLVSVYEGISATNVSFENKPSHFLVCKLFGESVYRFGDGKVIYACEGDVLYIPKGADYNVRKLSDGESRYIAVRFEADGLCAFGELVKFTRAEGSDYRDAFRNINQLWVFGSISRRMKCYSALYSLLSELVEDTHEYAGHSAKNVMSVCMKLLEKHMFDPDLSVEMLVARSGVSGTYFRRCFSRIYGSSPKEYIVQMRLSRARSILEGGDFGSISDVARAVGFEDPLYFGKVFKKKYGMPPSEYMR